MNRPNLPSALIAGLLGTTAMTAMMLAAPLLGMPAMDIADQLAGFMGVPVLVGWSAHYMIGAVLAGVYALVPAPRGPRAGWLRGALFSLLPWLMAQLVMLPLMGAPLFGGSALMAAGSLAGHLVYGTVLGAVYRPFQAAAPSAAAIL